MFLIKIGRLRFDRFLMSLISSVEIEVGGETVKVDSRSEPEGVELRKNWKVSRARLVKTTQR